MRVTLLSNGHGEDIVGATLAEKLLRLRPTLELRAFPTVGAGRAYERLNVPILGPRQALPSGGFTLHSSWALKSDLRAGFLPMTARQVRALRALSTDVLIVVGDVYALLLSNLVRTRARFYVQTLVSSHHQTELSGARGRALNRFFMERFSLPERLLIRRSVRHSYVRDAPTAALLGRYGIPVSALGNPMLDALEPARELSRPLKLEPPVVALLPGTREHAARALTLMLRALRCWPTATGLVAWAGERLPDLPGWRLEPLSPHLWQLRLLEPNRPDVSHLNVSRLDRTAVTDAGAATGPTSPQMTSPRVFLLTAHFAEVLHASQLVVGAAGTAHEQAAALGRPVVAFALPPLYTEAFVANQQRLLGAALHVCKAEGDALPAELAAALRGLWETPARYQQASQTGRERMGSPGGGLAIARDILKRVEFH